MEQTTSQSEKDLFFQAIIERYVDNNARFIKRDWLIEHIEKELGDPECRFVLITGEPGVGKTGLMAELAHRDPAKLRYFLRHDSQTPLRSGNLFHFLREIGFQLAERRPDLFESDVLEIVVDQYVQKLRPQATMVAAEIENLAASPFNKKVMNIKQKVDVSGGEVKGLVIRNMIVDDALLDDVKLQQMALFAPAQKLLDKEPGTRIVILVDALDELYKDNEKQSIIHWITNFAPDMLEFPANLRFVLTSRADDKLLQAFRLRQQRGLREIFIDTSSEEVKNDLDVYAQKFIAQDIIKNLLITRQLSPSRFAQQAVTKAEGNFLYLDMLFRAIEDLSNQEQLDQLLRLDGIPRGLKNLYHYFLTWITVTVSKKSVNSWDKETLQEREIPYWEGLIRPILGALSVAREALSIKQIMEFSMSKLEEHHLIDALGYVRQFLEVENDRYFLYHSTLPEFITAPETQIQYPQCYQAPDEWHSKIVGYYWHKPPVRGKLDWNKLDEYGIRHLSMHLAGAGMYEDLYLLVASGEEKNIWAEKHVEQDGSYIGYLSDLTLVWNHVTSTQSWHIGRQIRCVLIESSTHSLARNIVPRFLPVLIQSGYLPVKAAFANVLHIPHTLQLARSLTLIMPFLSEEMREVAFHRMKAIFHDSSLDEPERLALFCDIVPYLSPEQRTIALQAIWGKLQAMPVTNIPVKRLIALWKYFPDHIQTQAFTQLTTMKDGLPLIVALTGLFSLLTPEWQEQAYSRLQKIEDEDLRLAAQVRLVSYISGEEKADTLRRVLQMTHAYKCLDSLLHLLPSLEGEQRVWAANKVWATLQKLQDENHVFRVLYRCAPYLAEEQKEQALDFVWNRSSSSLWKIKTLFTLVNSLSRNQDLERQRVQSYIQQAIDEAQVQDDQGIQRISLLIELLPDLAEKQQRQLMDLIYNIPDQVVRTWELHKIIELDFLQCLPPDLQVHYIATEAAAQPIGDEGERATIRAVLSRYASEDIRREALLDATQIVEQLPDKINQALAWLGLTEYVVSEEQQAQFVNKAIVLMRSSLEREDIGYRLIDYLPNNVLHKFLWSHNDIWRTFPHFVEIQASLKGIVARQQEGQVPKEITATDIKEEPSNDERNETILNVLRALYMPGDRKRLAASLDQILNTRSTSNFLRGDHQTIWCESLLVCAHHDRKRCMQDLLVLIPLALYLSNDPSVENEVLKALRDVERWWN